MLIANKKIAIIGGGMAGLTLARLLQLQNAEVKVYERDFNRDVRVQGSTLDLHEGSGLEAMKRAGLLADFYANYRPMASKLRIVDKSLDIKFDNHNFDKTIAENRPEIDRAPLRNILLNALKPGTVVWDSQFAVMQREGSGWLLQFGNGSSAYADLVIAADGANSKVRPYLSTEKAVYSGVILVEGNIYHAAENAPKLFQLSKDGKVMAFGDEQTLMYGTKGDGSMMFVASFKVPQNWLNQNTIDFKNKEQVLAWFKTAYTGWSDEWQELFTSNEVNFIPRPQYYFPFDQSWQTQENLTMIGDAFELAACLTGNTFTDIKTAIAHFEKQMIERAAIATQETLVNTELMHSADALAQMVGFFSQVEGE